MIDTTACKELSRIRFAAMDPVPEWLLAAEPMHPQARRGTIRFTMATDVIDVGDYYVVIPRPIGGSPVGVFSFDGQGCQVNAISKPVETVIFKSVINGTDYAEGKTNPEVLTQVAPAPPSEAFQQVGQLGVDGRVIRRRTLGERVRDFFR